MKFTWKRALPVSFVVAVLVSAMASLAFAGDGGSAPNGSVLARKGWSGRESGVILGYIAGKANVDVKTLMDEFKGGKSLQDIAAEHGLDLTALKNELAADAPVDKWFPADKGAGVILGYIAGKANVDVKTLMDEFKGGKSLQDIAAEHGLDLEAIKAQLAAKVAVAKNLAGKDVRGIFCYIAGKANADVKTLMDEFKAGKSLEDIAAEHGLDLAAIEARIASDRSNGGRQFFAPGGFGRRAPARRGGKGM
jgi:uncharacterized protein (DUF433 family)